MTYLHKLELFRSTFLENQSQSVFAGPALIKKVASFFTDIKYVYVTKQKVFLLMVNLESFENLNFTSDTLLLGYLFEDYLWNSCKNGYIP